MSPSLKEMMNLAIFAFLAPSLAKTKSLVPGCALPAPTNQEPTNTLCFEVLRLKLQACRFILL
jgi:hypothetical protein